MKCICLENFTKVCCFYFFKDNAKLHRNIYYMLYGAKSKTSVFATDGIWVTFSLVLNFLLLGWTPWMGFQNERPMCFHNRQKRHGHSWACCYSNTICKCDGRNRLFHFFRPSHFKDCVAIAMWFNCGSIFSLSRWSILVALLCSILSV